MKIVLNDQELDVTMQNERTVGDVVSQIEGWLADSGMHVARVSMDKTDLTDTERNRWQDFEVDSVEELEFEAALPADHDPNAIETLLDYFELLARNLESASEEPLRDVAGEFQYVEQATGRVLRIHGDAELLLSPIRGITESILCGGDWQSLRQEAGETVNAIISRLQSRLSELLRPEAELGITAKLLEDQLSGISEVAVLLQQGRDQEAMSRIVRFSDLCAKFTRLNPEAKTSDLIAPLNELVGAFDNSDSVLIGDLLEYEIVPFIEREVAKVKDHSNA